MDPVALIFYALVCGCLGYFAPQFGGSALRFGIGAVVGIVAAALLPVIRGAFGL